MNALLCAGAVVAALLLLRLGEWLLIWGDRFNWRAIVAPSSYIEWRRTHREP